MVTTSLAARARTSAQETTPGQAFSTAALARTTVSKPSPARDWLSGASFSASLLPDAIITDASQPCTVDNNVKLTTARGKTETEECMVTWTGNGNVGPGLPAWISDKSGLNTLNFHLLQLTERSCDHMAEATGP
jgi:hypothetical protein